MKPRLSLAIAAIIGAFLVGLGLTITGDFWRLPWWIGYYNQGLGYSLFDLGAGSFLVYVFVDLLLLREKRQIGIRAECLVRKELLGLVADLKTGGRFLATDCHWKIPRLDE